ncbi:MAG TPA: TIGR03435 family protein [Acidobacteriaceae bacterium]|nr:TIGR03435 family protein [Acidobacteriaceae bacterium]
MQKRNDATTMAQPRPAGAMLLALLILALPTSHGVQAQSAATVASPAPMAFDVVSVKPHSGSDSGNRMQTMPDGIRLLNISLEQFICQAYGLDFDAQLVGAPDWTRTQHFDIVAKVAGADAAAFQKLKFEQIRPMALPILADRFKFAAHMETRPLPVYALILANGGSKLRQATPGDGYSGGIKGADGIGHPNVIGVHTVNNPDQTVTREMTAQAVTISRLVTMLSQLGQDRLVIDKTGLGGTYDFKLTWTTDKSAAPGAGLADGSGPSIFTALQEQLGLKLHPEKDSVPVLVVDHVEKLSDN